MLNATHKLVTAYDCKKHSGNLAGTVTGTNFVFCPYGKFQPGRPWWNSRNTTKMVGYKLVSFAAVEVLWTLVTLLTKLIRILLKWKYKAKIKPFWPPMLRKRSYFVRRVQDGVFIGENFCPSYWDLGRRNRDLSNLASPASYKSICKFSQRKEWQGNDIANRKKGRPKIIWRRIIEKELWEFSYTLQLEYLWKTG